MKLYKNPFLRKIFLPLFSKINLGNIKIKHHYTGDSFLLHSFKHKGYWFHGKKREFETMQLFSKFIKPGHVVFDVGGHIGYTALYFSKLTGSYGKVYVFEPGKNNLYYLEQNVKNKPNIIVVPKGAANIDGKLDFFLENLTGQNNSFVNQYQILKDNANLSNIKPEISRITVDVVKLDTFADSINSYPDFVKIDVEGFELEVLLGMEKILKQKSPILMIEITRNKENIFNLLKDNQYFLFDSNLQKINKFEEISLNTFCFKDIHHIDK
jgi:FkbM family methyltransferase